MTRIWAGTAAILLLFLGCGPQDEDTSPTPETSPTDAPDLTTAPTTAPTAAPTVAPTPVSNPTPTPSTTNPTPTPVTASPTPTATPPAPTPDTSTPTPQPASTPTPDSTSPSPTEPTPTPTAPPTTPTPTGPAPTPVSLPQDGAVVINELLAHAHEAAPDWIELHNTTDIPVDLGGWFLSDTETNLERYEIPQGTILAAHGYIVFQEDASFGAEGASDPFALSAFGEAVYLSSGANQELTGYQVNEDFGASESGIAFGRYQKSTGAWDFVAMAVSTPGATNGAPKVGPVVITEVYYNPQSGVDDEEFIELLNLTDSPLELFDGEGNPWIFSLGVTFTFPGSTTLAAGERIVVSRNPSVFAATYPKAPSGLRVFGPYDGKLDNGGEKLELAKPGEKDDEGTLYYIRVDRVSYDDEDPWPTSTDGGGDSLHRIDAAAYGNDVANWRAAQPSPGE